LRWSAYRLRTKALIVVALPVLPLAFFWTITWIAMIQADIPENTTDRNLIVQAGTARVFSALLDADAGARDNLLTDNAAALSRYHAAIDRLPPVLAQLNNAVIDPGLRQSLGQLNDVVEDELAVLVRLTDTTPAKGHRLGERAALDRSAGNLRSLRTLTNTIEQRQAALAAERAEQVDRWQHTLFVVLLVGSVVCVGLGVIVSLLKSKSLTTRIVLLSRNADRLARGEELAPLPKGEDEIAQLDASFRQAAHLLSLREEELRHSSYLLDSFFNNLSYDLFCIVGPDGRFKRVNPAWEVTLKSSSEELLAAPLIDLVHPDDRGPMNLAFAGKDGQATLDSRLRCKDGSYRWLRWNVRPHAEDGVVYASARDVTYERQLNAALHARTSELEAANAELEAFSYSVSHDLRAPLRAIAGFSQTIEEDFAERLDEDGRDALRRVRKAAQRMGSLIDELLNLSRLSRTELRRERLDLGAAAASILADLGRGAMRHVDVSIAPNLFIEADPHLLRIALQNLLDNAWKYTGKTNGARIEVGSSPNGHARVFYVRDNGAGFDMTYSSKLFGPFQRLHTHHEFEGTGVGLATVQRIVNRHGGKIWADATVNAGATFYFTLEPEDADHA
jgi:PAS domain S-box-containing protein